MSTNLTSVGGTVSYYHHVHSLTSTNDYVVTNSATPTTNGLADNYQATTSGGCFRSVYVPQQTGRVYATGQSWGDGSWAREYYCESCGTLLGREGSKSDYECPWHDGDVHVCREAYYQVSLVCGHTRGQVVKAVIDY